MPESSLPAHIAIVMDGNGRWAERRRQGRSKGHQAGLRALRKTCQHGADIGIGTFTVFAFSSENWRRPAKEVSRLMDLFMSALDKEIRILHEHGARIRFIGDLNAFRPELQKRMRKAQELTGGNDRMCLNVAVNYGGRWDILQATRELAQAVQDRRIAPGDIDESAFAGALSLAGTDDPDLFIRTGGEMRVSNFMLWQMAYTEFYFSPLLWPDFDGDELDRAIEAYRMRERRFGRTGAQLREAHA